MRIGIDVFSLDKPGGNYGVGMGIYAWSLLPELIKQGKDHQFIIFANKDNKDLIPLKENVTICVSPISNKYRFLRIIHEQLYLPFQFFRNKLDIIHFLGINISLLLSNRSIITIHDLMWKYYYDMGNPSPKFIYYRLISPISIKRSKGIITVSRFVAKEIGSEYMRTINVYPIHHGPGDCVKPSINDISHYAQKYNFKYIYTVTTSMPHKNLKVLLEAFLKIKRNNLFIGKLLITGQLKGNFHEKTLKFITDNHLERDIILTGFIPSKEKAYCYQNAFLFVFPSLYEGFGIPLLEAMNLGVPILAANSASLPEVGGDACIYFDPNSSDNLFDKITHLMNDTKKQKEMIEHGKAKSETYSWEKAAKETLQAYKNVFKF